MHINLVAIAVVVVSFVVGIYAQIGQSCKQGEFCVYKRKIQGDDFVILISPNPIGNFWEVRDISSDTSYISCIDHDAQIGSDHFISRVAPTQWQGFEAKEQQTFWIYNRSYHVRDIEELSCEPRNQCCALAILPIAMHPSSPTMPPNATKCPEPNCNGWCDAATALVVVLVVILLLATLVAFIVIFQFLWRKSSSRNTIGSWQSESLQNYLRDSFEKRIDFHMVKLEYAAGTLQLRAGQFLYRHSNKGKLVSIFVYTEEVPPGVIRSLGEGFVFLVSETDCRGPLTVLPALSAQDGRINDLTEHLRSCLETERVQEEIANQLRSRVETLTEENAALEEHLRSCMETKRVQEEIANQLRSQVETLTKENAALEAGFGIEEENRQPSPSRNGATPTATNRAESDGVVASSSDVAEETPVVTHDISLSAEGAIMVRQGSQLSLPTSKMEAGTSGTTQTTLL